MMVDYLNRTKDKNKVLEIIKTSIENKEKRSMAINGKWGSGKSYFLSLLEEELDNNYFVIKYDAWENDYYDDPLIGILDLLKDKLNSYNLYLKTIKHEINKIFKQISNVITSYLDGFLEKKTGFSIRKIIRYLKESHEETLINGDFNSSEKLKIAKKIIIKALNEISKEKTIIFIVDEIDRCAPSYTLKIMERLHHIFENVDGCILLFGVDVDQLQKAICDLYSTRVLTDKELKELSQNYLRKIIDSTYNLGNGNLDKKFSKEIEKYRKCFSEPIFNTSEEEVSEFICQLFANSEMRNTLKIIKNAMTIHKLIFKSEVYSADLMCAELMLCWAGKEFGDEMLSSMSSELDKSSSNYSFIKYLSSWEYPTRRIIDNPFSGGKDIEIRDLKSLLFYYVKYYKRYVPVCNGSRFKVPKYFSALVNDYLMCLIQNKC